VTEIEVGLEALSIETYVSSVLPESLALWGGGRSLERYAEDFRAVASSTYMKRRPFTVGILDGGRIVSSCKNYDRELRWDGAALRTTGIGAVFTPPALRGRGYASVMLGALLDAERAAGRDVAFLYSDIHPAFYEKLGFVAVPSRTISLRAASLDGSPCGAEPLAPSDWAAVRRCFEALDGARPWSLRRTPLVWDWMRRRFDGPPQSGEQPVRLIVRRRRSIIAYVLGRRVVRRDAFVVDDFAFDGDEGRQVLGPLLRSAAGDLSRIAGWLPPPLAREALPAGSVRSRKDAILMFVPISPRGRAWWKASAEALHTSRSDATWSADHV
jgi:GNAT superfamily N-acetyltransferase